MIILLVFRLAIIFHWSSLIGQAVNGRMTEFVVVRPGQIPVAGVWPLATVSTDSVIECAMKCWNSGDSGGCGAFVFRPDSCQGTSGLLAKSGSCDFLQFFNFDALSYEPANSSCETFYVVDTRASPAVNIAVNKPTSQMSTYGSQSAFYAVDGNIGTDSCTNSAYNPWWSVDLQQTYLVGEVDVVNDLNPVSGAAHRLDNFYVKLANVQPIVGQPLSNNCTLCGQYNGSLPPLGTGQVFCSFNATRSSYRYVIVQGSLASFQALCLVEVQVYVVGR